jgi:D-beta-D-heptose 7-phosphate kinase/D-beta-D-heptose 1-phosphate adenosyltransferase
MRGRRVLVLGDVMLDEFLWGRVARISPEAPVPVVEVTRESYLLGGAGNVAGNVRSLGGEAVVAGVVGRDAAGERLREALARAGIEDAVAVAPDSRPTTLKTRVIAHHQQVVRADRERAEEISGELEKNLAARMEQALPRCRAVVLSDYLKGVLTSGIMKRLLAAARAAGIPVFVDPKVRHFARYRRVAVVTPNQAEAEEATGVRIRTPRDLEAAGRRIVGRLECQAALITRGEHGMSLFPRSGRTLHIETAAREVFDVTGAGDTVVAALALAASAGASLPHAAMLANVAAGVVVGKLGTATASPQEILAALDGWAGA